MFLSFAVLCKDEVIETQRLLDLLTHVNWSREVEIVMLADGDDCECYKRFYQYQSAITFNSNLTFRIHQRKLDNFANQKNALFELCEGKWIYNLDADELIHDSLIRNDNLFKVLDSMERANMGMIYVPRINTVEGITQEHIDKWGWVVDDKNRINFPDFQSRIVYNSPLQCKWVGAVHETLKFTEQSVFKKFTYLPRQDVYCILHHKHINKQEQQNKLYERMG